MEIISAGQHPTRQGPAEWFTGTVWMDPIVIAAEPSRLRATRVSFAPGARTAWHTHPVGQVIHIMTGLGRVQREGGPVFVVNAGDTVIFAPGERHWHGAAPHHAMVHIAMQEADESGTHVTWLEHVADADYQQEPQSPKS
jgi:quercetin dioxygenase-like cupin family protein